MVSTIGQRDDPRTTLADTLHACVERFRPALQSWLDALPRHHLLLFAASSEWSQPNVIARRRALWGTEDLRWLPREAPRSPDVTIASDDGTRFAGLACLSISHFAAAADYVRTHDAGMLYLSANGELSEERVRAAFNTAFPKRESKIDWAAVIESERESKGVYFRVQGAFDDREAAIDAFMEADMLDALSAITIEF